jgi:basic amino acid/polyamine antiporter, APA family
MNFTELFRKKSFTNIAHEQVAEANQVKKILTTTDLTLFGIAAIVGAGIFSTVGHAAAHGGPAVVLLFVFTALSCGLSALCYAQFASAIPLSGSAYTYAYVSFGELIAWIVGWDLFMEYAVSNVAVAISWSDYFASFMLGLGVVIPKTIAWGANEIRLDIPAFIITSLVTFVCYIGIRASKNTNQFLVGFKLLVIFLILVVGFFYISPENWTPFAPHGVSGVMMSVSSVFFAYIGFDAVSTTAEECTNPQKQLPKAMVYCLVISTVIYILITLVLTGMIPSALLGVGDPLAFVFAQKGLFFFSSIISLVSVVTLSSVMLVYQLGQPRIWMAMSRDGLLPKIFSTVHHKFKTPSFSTLVMGICVAVPALFVDMTTVIDLTSAGTLFAFALVCSGVLVQEHKKVATNSKFTIPYLNARYFLPLLLLVLLFVFPPSQWDKFSISTHTILFYLFILSSIGIAIWTIVKQLSLIPTLGLISNIYLMSELGIINWFRFFIWLALGAVVYFSFSFKNSRLNTSKLPRI